MYESVVSGMMEGRGVGAGLGGCRGGPFIPALGPGERLPSTGLWGVVLCRVDWTHRLVPFSLGSLGGHPGRGCGRAGVGHRDSGDPPPHASGWVLVQLVFQSVGSFLVGGDDWGGLSFPYWVFLPPA